MDKDCAVCERLMKEKHKNDKFWKVACIVCLLIAIVFIVLYFSDASIGKETTITIQGTEIGNNNGDNTSINIGSDGATTVTGTMQTEDKSSVLIFAGILVAAIVVCGGIIYACNVIRENNNNNKR